jgi:hypothetical protein
MPHGHVLEVVRRLEGERLDDFKPTGHGAAVYGIGAF